MLDLQSRLEIQRDYRRAKFFMVYTICMLALLTVCAIGEAKQARAEEPDDLSTLQQEICTKTHNSPLCGDFSLLQRIDTIGDKKGVPTRLIVGIMYAESTNATNYNKPICKTRNNPYGIKGRKFDDGHVEWFSGNGKADKDGCWLYQFSSIEEATESLVNTISMGYRTCENRTHCISFSYVGKADVAEESWKSRVGVFYKD